MKSKLDFTKMVLSTVIFTITLLFSCSKPDLPAHATQIAGSPKDSLPPVLPQESVLPIYDRTTVSIEGDQFFINGKPTYEGRYWQGKKIEGLLLNSRMVQGIFDDLNPDTMQMFAYPDTKTWNAERNTNDFVAAMPEWKNNGLLAFTLNLQGGSPTGYGNAKPWKNSAFDENGTLRRTYLHRLRRILDRADQLQMVVILGYFYFGQDELLKNEAAITNAVDGITHWILDNGYRNVIVEIDNECDNYYKHDILRPDRVHELIDRVHGIQRDGFSLPVSTSYSGGVIPSSDVVRAVDFILLHGNGLDNPARIGDIVASVKNKAGYVPKPIVFNEDDHYDFEVPENNLVSAINAYASWGFFDFRRQGEDFKAGYQSVPVDWGINSDRKRGFFSKLKEITGY